MDESENLIEDLGLNELQVLQIVKEWYTNGMTPDLFHSEDGDDLEEYCEMIQDSIRAHRDKKSLLT